MDPGLLRSTWIQDPMWLHKTSFGNYNRPRWTDTRLSATTSFTSVTSTRDGSAKAKFKWNVGLTPVTQAVVQINPGAETNTSVLVQS